MYARSESAEIGEHVAHEIAMDRRKERDQPLAIERRMQRRGRCPSRATAKMLIAASHDLEQLRRQRRSNRPLTWS